MYGGEYYPNYLSGTAYVLGIDAVTKLFKKSLSVPLFHLEDVYITGIVASQLKLKRQHHPLFFYSTTKDTCALRGMISQHKFTAMEFQVAYNFITNVSIPCRTAEKVFAFNRKLIQKKRCL
jgi:beta-1,3-galactosyltransferase 1